LSKSAQASSGLLYYQAAAPASRTEVLSLPALDICQRRAFLSLIDRRFGRCFVCAKGLLLAELRSV
jgi:hypothetical protein